MKNAGIRNHCVTQLSVLPSVRGDLPAEIGIDRRNNSDITGGVSAFITAFLLRQPVTLRASGPCH